MSEKWQNLPFFSRTLVLVLVPKVDTDTHGQRQSGIGTQSQKGVGTSTNKVVTVPMLPAALIFVFVH